MRLCIIGDGDSARALRGQLHAMGYAVTKAHTEGRPDYTVEIVESAEPFVSVDSVGSAAESAIVSAVVSEIGNVVIKRRGPTADDRQIVVTLPGPIPLRDKAERALRWALLSVFPLPDARDTAPKKPTWWAKFLPRRS